MAQGEGKLWLCVVLVSFRVQIVRWRHELQVSFRSALKCNNGNASARAHLESSIRRIGRVQEDIISLPLKGTARRDLYDRDRRNALGPFSARTAETLRWAEAHLRQEQGQRKAAAEAQGPALAQKEGTSVQGGAASRVPSAAVGPAAPPSGDAAAAAHRESPMLAVPVPVKVQDWTTWADGKSPTQTVQWLIDCYRLRESDDWLGPNAHFHWEDCRKLATLPLLVFCKLAVHRKVLPPKWDWGVFFSK